MNSKLLASAIVFAIAFGTPDMGFALERASQNALTFFKRYESEITNNYRRLEECSRKLAVTDGSKADDLLIEAEEIMDRIQKRYDLLDDQYSFTASTYPADRNALRDGFAPIEDKYREIRNFYTDNFKNRGKAKKEAVSKEPAKKSVTAPANSAVSSGTSPKLDDASYQEALAALRRPATNKAEEQKLAKEAAAKKAAEEKAAKEAAKQEALKIAEEQKAAKEAAKQAAREAAAQRVAEEKAAKEAAKQEALKIAEEKKAAKEAAKQAAREASAQRAAEEKAAREAAKAAKQTASVAPVSMPSPAVESDSYQEALAALKRPSSKSAKKQDKKAEQPKQTVISEKDLEALAKAKAKEEAIREVKENAKSGVSNDFLKSLAAVKKNSGIKGNPEVASIKPRKSAKELEAERQAQIEAEKMAQLAMELKTRAEEEKAKLEAKQAMEEQAKARAEAQAKAKAEALAKLEAEKKAKEEAEKKAREKAEIIAQIKAEALQRAKAAEEAREREKAEAIARAVAEKEAEMRAKVEAERKAQEEALARIEAEKRAQEEAEKRAQEKARAAALAELKAREEAEKKAKEEARAQLLAEMKAKAEAEAERKAREEAERIAKAEAEKRAKERARAAVLAEMKAKEEAEKKAKEELEKKAFEEARAQLLAEKKSREAKFAAQTAPALTKAEIRKQTLAEIAAEQALEEKDAVKAAVVTTNAFAAAVNNAARATGSAIDTTSASYAEALSALKRDPKKIAEEKKQARAQAKLEAEQKAQEEAFAKAQAKAEAEQKAKEEALAKAQAKIDAERIAKAEETAKAQAREEALAKAKAAEEARKQAIEEAKVLAAKKAAEDTLMDIPAFKQQLEDDKAADMADVLKAIEIKQAIEAEKIRAARKAKELAEAEKARKAADEALKQAEREAERIARRAARAANEDEDKLKLTGVVSVEIKNREEKYKAQNVVGRPNGESKLPNDMNQFKLSLAYQSSENHLFTLDERYVQRERNEVVKENYLDISYWTKQNNARAWKVANSFQTTEYPDTDSKDYRDNKFEVSMERTAENREGVTTLGYQVRSYPNYERADYNQISVKDTENSIRTDGSLYGEGRIDTRKYSNYSDLDYNNQNLYLEYTKIFENNSELTIADTYDRRNYDKEAPRLYRSSYFDNYFRLNYLMPTDGIFTYEVEVQHTKHDYDSDKDRGYAETNLWFASKMKLTKKTRAQLDFRYIDNDENSRILAHKNNEIHFMVQKNVNDMFRVRFDHTYHNRDSVVGNSMNFDEHTSEAKLSWIMEKNFDVAWKVGYNSRIYDTTQYEDYRTYSTGLDVRYEKRNQYEWRLTPYVRKIEFRNFYKEGMPEPVKNWEDEIQPCIEFEYVKPLKEDLRFTFNASYEKTYYKTYDAGMQDLIWNFAKPMEITQFVGKLEQSF